MILVYSYSLSNRLHYTLNVLFKYILGVDYKVTTNLDFFKEAKGLKLNYSKTEVDDCFSILPSSFLFEKKIEPQNIQVTWIHDIPYFFETETGKYDMLASSFYMLSRYEEYLPFKPDVHGRFSAKESTAYQHNFLHLPVVNIWAENLKKELLKSSPNFVFPEKKMSFLNTLDIDIAYAYKGKPLWKFFGGLFRDFIKGNKQEITYRIDYLKHKKDIYNTYDWLDNYIKKENTIYFFLLGDSSTYDLNISPKKRVLKKLIQKLSLEHSVGIHPSYLSNQEPKRVSKEIKRLEKITKQNTSISRQHFLKLEFPKTYENLIANEIKVDYTMGYADEVGFRAGICNVYPFYNLQEEIEKPLWIVPFQVMDGTLKTYLELEPQEAVVEIEKIIEEVKKVNGLFVSLWHNSSLGEAHGWEGWQNVYKKMLKATE